MRTLLTLLLVVLTITVFVLPAVAAPDTTRLNLSHVCDPATGELEFHFVLVQYPPDDYTGTFVSYQILVDGVLITGTAPYTSENNGTIHYTEYYGGQANSIEVLPETTLVVGDTTYQVANPGVFSTGVCRPLGVAVEEFSATCIPGTGVRITWISVEELHVSVWELGRNANLIAAVPAQHPGAPLGASYVYTDTVYTGTPVYTLGGFGDTVTTTAVCTPSAVNLTAFSAR